MKRIGIAASKIAHGNLVLYNLYVVLISFVFSLFIYILAALSVFFALLLIDYFSREFAGFQFQKSKSFVFTVCMVSLTILVALFNILAISINIKLSKGKD